MTFLNYEFVSAFWHHILECGSSDGHMPAGPLPCSKHEILSKLTYSSIINPTVQLFKVLFDVKSLFFSNRLCFLWTDKGWIICWHWWNASNKFYSYIEHKNSLVYKVLYLHVPLSLKSLYIQYRHYYMKNLSLFLKSKSIIKDV